MRTSGAGTAVGPPRRLAEWSVSLFHDGNRLFRGTRQTEGPSGSSTVRVLANNTAGTDSFSGRATNVASGEVCRGSASIG
jgi:hypothetical protein